MKQLIYGLITIITAAIAFWAGINFANKQEKQHEAIKDASLCAIEAQAANHGSSSKTSPNATISVVSQETISTELTESGDPSDTSDSYTNATEPPIECGILSQQLDEAIVEHYQLLSLYEQTAQLLRDAGIDPPENIQIPQEEIDKLEYPFNDVVENMSYQMKKTFLDIREEAQDYDWAIQFETRVSDFFAVHELSQEVSLANITCKTKQCELYGFQNSGEAFSTIMKDLNNETWFSSTQTNSITGDTSLSAATENGDAVAQSKGYFYVTIKVLRFDKSNNLESE